jgi:hypothetical protein
MDQCLKSVLYCRALISGYDWDVLDSQEYDETKERMFTHVADSCDGMREVSVLLSSHGIRADDDAIIDRDASSNDGSSKDESSSSLSSSSSSSSSSLSSSS